MLTGAAAALLLSAFSSFAGHCESVKQEVLRLHILPHSNSASDQQLKYDLRDFLLSELCYSLADAQTFEEAKNTAERILPETQRKAREFIALQGYDYEVVVSLENIYFTTRVYENITMPAGNYYALAVRIGSGQGSNWWCVAFPPLCLPAASGKAEHPQEPYFTPETSEIIENGGRIEIKFAIYEWFKARFG